MRAVPQAIPTRQRPIEQQAGGATRRLFPLLFHPSLAVRRETYTGLVGLGEADEVLEAALAAHRAEGHEGPLVEAAKLLADIGPRSWPALRRVVGLGTGESEAFVGVIASLPGIAREDRLELLRELASCPDENVRRRVLEEAGGFAGQDRSSLLHGLAGGPDSVGEEATSLLRDEGDACAP